MSTKKIAVIPGDGIGKEVIPAAVEIIRRLGLGLEFHPLPGSRTRFPARPGQPAPASPGRLPLSRSGDSSRSSSSISALSSRPAIRSAAVRS